VKEVPSALSQPMASAYPEPLEAVDAAHVHPLAASLRLGGQGTRGGAELPGRAAPDEQGVEVVPRDGEALQAVLGDERDREPGVPDPGEHVGAVESGLGITDDIGGRRRTGTAYLPLPQTGMPVYVIGQPTGDYVRENESQMCASSSHKVRAGFGRARELIALCGADGHWQRREVVNCPGQRLAHRGRQV
jgi:hypothetical protein